MFSDSDRRGFRKDCKAAGLKPKKLKTKQNNLAAFPRVPEAI